MPQKKYNISEFDMAYIIEKITGKKRLEQILENTLSDNDIYECEKILDRYFAGEPLNKIFCEQNFYGFDFYINNNVLAPRPETEILVECALKKMSGKPKILDLCTGSGIIGITIKKLYSNADVTMSDISIEALEVAQKNATNLDAEVNIIKSDLFENISDKYDMILSNPPYIKLTDKDNLDKSVLDYDPHIALFGGNDGMEFYNKILQDAHKYLLPQGIIIFEIGYDIKESIEKLATENNYNITFLKDYNNIDRVAILERKIIC